MAWTVFRHPCIIRGIVATPYGRFAVERGIVRAPDNVGLRLGWVAIVPDAASPLSTGVSPDQFATMDSHQGGG